MYRSPSGKVRTVIEWDPKNKKRFKTLSAQYDKTYEEIMIILMDLHDRHPELWPKEALTSSPAERPKGVY